MTNKITIENINGVPHTVVWHHGEDEHYDVHQIIKNEAGGYFIYCSESQLHIATALPPLPLNPTKAYDRLYCAYEMHGLTIVGTYLNFEGYSISNVRGHFDTLIDNERFTTTHAIDEQGESSEIAIINTINQQKKYKNMTNDLKFKKYRRKVSNKRVEKAAKQVFHTDWEYKIPMVKNILEANAEVIEGEIIQCEIYHTYYFYMYKNNKYTGLLNFETLEQFHAEWEEIC